MIKFSLKNFLLATFSVLCVGMVDVWGAEVGGGGQSPGQTHPTTQPAPAESGFLQQLHQRQTIAGSDNKQLSLAALIAEQSKTHAIVIEGIPVQNLKRDMIGTDIYSPENLERYLGVLQAKTDLSADEQKYIQLISKFVAHKSGIATFVRDGYSSGDKPKDVIAEVFCGGVFGHMPLGFRKNATNIAIAVTAFIVLNIFKELLTTPFKNFFSNATNPFARLLKYISKDLDAERLADLAENVKMFATDLRTFLRDIKTLCANLDNGMKARQAGLIDVPGGNSPLPIVGEGAGQISNTVSLLEGFKMTCESFLEDIDSELGQDKKPGTLTGPKAKKFKSQISRLKALKHEIQECKACICQIGSISDLTDQKKMSVFNGRVMAIENLCNLLLKSLTQQFSVVRANQPAGGRAGGFGGGQYGGQYA